MVQRIHTKIVPVVQWIECWPPEPEIGGSNPPRDTIWTVSSVVERFVYTEEVAGSIPAPSTKKKFNGASRRFPVQARKRHH